MTISEESVQASSGNGPAIAAMLFAMAILIVNDTLIKLASDNLPSSEIMAIRGTFATVLIAAMAWRAGAFRYSEGLTARPVMLRVFGEVGATVTFMLALFNMPIGNVTAIMQVVPLFIVASASFFLREHVGWRRWVAALTGFAGVMLIIRPGAATFTPWALLALVAVGFVALRDLATRRIDPSVPSLLVTFITAAAVAALGYLMYPLQTWQMPQPREWAMLMIAAICMAGAYYAMVLAMRSGDIAVVSPFRYSVVLWALLSGQIIWGERPDNLALVGTAIVIAAGLYTFLRERRIHTTSPSN